MLFLVWFACSGVESRGAVYDVHDVAVQDNVRPSAPVPFLDLTRLGLKKNMEGQWTIQEGNQPVKVVGIEFSVVLGDKLLTWHFNDNFDNVLSQSGTKTGFNLKTFIEQKYPPEVGMALSWTTVEWFDEIAVSFVFKVEGAPAPDHYIEIAGEFRNDSPYAFKSWYYWPAPDHRSLQNFELAPYSTTNLHGRVISFRAWIVEKKDGGWTARLVPVNMPKVTIAVVKEGQQQMSTVPLPPEAVLDADGWMAGDGPRWILDQCPGLDDPDYWPDPDVVWKELPIKTNWLAKNECTVTLRRKPDVVARIVNTGDVPLTWGEGVFRMELAPGESKVVEQTRMAHLPKTSLRAAETSPGGAREYDCEVQGPGIMATGRGTTNEYRIAAYRKAVLSIVRPEACSVEIRNGQGWSTNLPAGSAPVRIGIPWADARDAGFSVLWTPVDAKTYVGGQDDVRFGRPGDSREVVCRVELRAITVSIGNNGRVPIQVAFQGKTQKIAPGRTKDWENVKPTGTMPVHWEPCDVPPSLWTGGSADLTSDSFSVGAQLDGEQVGNRVKAISGRYRAAQNAEPTEDVSLQPLLNSLKDLKGSGLTTRMLPEPLPSWNALRDLMELRAAANPADSPAAQTATECLATMMRHPGGNDYYGDWDDFMEWQP